ncbi:hypothetical protein Bpla01_26290 [Burkholderia plantarii]|nr:hypothetical protein Bpla01_26290 [Burkholderia plantarii]
MIIVSMRRDPMDMMHAAAVLPATNGLTNRIPRQRRVGCPTIAFAKACRERLALVGTGAWTGWE